MTRPSTDLATAIAEAIQDHADRYRGGKADARELFDALGEVGCMFMANVTDPADRACAAGYMFRRLVEGAELPADRAQ